VEARISTCSSKEGGENNAKLIHSKVNNPKDGHATVEGWPVTATTVVTLTQPKGQKPNRGSFMVKRGGQTKRLHCRIDSYSIENAKAPWDSTSQDSEDSQIKQKR
jgi:hypothetical protein